MLLHHSHTEDVVVAGAGIAGLAAALRLARAGLRVTCIEPHQPPRSRVGESLDWSAPPLLRCAGIDPAVLVADGVATYKRQVHGFTVGGLHLEAGPPAWFGRWPLQFECVTVHVDRERFDRLMFSAAADAGVDFVQAHVAHVTMNGDTVDEVVDSTGVRHRATWFVDASGRGRVLGRTASIGCRRWGRERIAMWWHCESPMDLEGTALYFDDEAQDLTWGWEIPIDARRRSRGVVVPLTEFRRLRQELGSLERTAHSACGRLRGLEAPDTGDRIHVRGYQPYVSDRVVGGNWVMIGEAAAFVDPLASLGVTAAMRHAAEAAELITAESRTAQRASRYERRLRLVACLYNDALDRLMYSARLRRRFGMREAARSYVVLGYATNALYTRLRPAMSRTRTLAFAFVLGFFRVWILVWSWAARVPSLQRSRRSAYAAHASRSGPFVPLRR